MSDVFTESVRKNLIWGDIVTLRLVLDLAELYRVQDHCPAFIAGLRALEKRFEKDLVDATESK